MILFIEIGLTPCSLILPKFSIAVGQKLPVAQRLNAYVLFLAGGAIAGKSKYIRPRRHHRVDNAGNFVDVLPGNSGHDHRTNPRPIDAAALFQRCVKTAGLAEPVVSLTKAVYGKLVFFASVFFQPAAHFVRQVEGIAQNGKSNAVLLH